MQLSKEYFEWMRDLVCGDDKQYETLLRFLHEKTFYYIHPLDENREQDGLDLKYRFGWLHDIPDDVIERELGRNTCSVLEMMIALAVRCEESIMDDYDFGNRTGTWFFDMLKSLEIDEMDDENFNEVYVDEAIERMLEREYGPDGEGGLCYLPGCDKDLREVDIWYQMMWYLDRVL